MKTFRNVSPRLKRIVPVIGYLTLLHGSGKPCLAQQSQPALQISSPTPGTVLNPGQTLSVTVTSPAGLAMTSVWVIGELPVGFVGSATSVPATVSSTIPVSISPGPYMLGTMGVTSSGQLVQSDTILIDVERADSPISLATKPMRILFQSQGQRQPLSASATFSDGSVLAVTSSARMVYSSSNSGVVTVDANGSVTAVGAGGAIITASYGQSLAATVPVIVAPPLLASSPPSLSFPPQNIWTTSGSRTLSLTNVSENSGLTITAVAATGDFSETDNCVSAAPLAINLSCTISITFTPTTGGPRTGAIRVTNSMTAAPFAVALTGTGNAASSAPTITTLSPTSGLVGTSVTIAGTNFGTTQGTSTVAFNGTTASPMSWSGTSVAVPVPTGATTGDVTINVAGQRSNGVSFIVSVPPPSITSLSPTSGAAGASVTITGANFGAVQGTSTVTFNGTTAMPASWNATSIVVPVPNGATTGNVLVTARGQESNGLNFTVGTAPTIASLSPNSGALGTSITITGTNFGAAQGTSTVKFNGTTATLTGWSATSIVAPVPSGATTGNVVATVGGVASNGVNFTVQGTTNGIALVQLESRDAGTTTSYSLPFDSNNAAGNWIGVCVRAGPSGESFTVTDSRGNTYHQAIQLNMTVDTPNGDTLAIFYAENISAGANTITVSDTISGSLRFAILEYTGVATANSLDVTASAQGTSTSPSSGNATTTASGDLLLGAVATADVETFTAPNGVQIRAFVPSEPSTKLIAEDQIQAAAGTAAATASLGASDPWGAVLATFKKAHP